MASRSPESLPADQQRVEVERIAFPPIIVVLAGLPRTGKGTLANTLAQQTNLIHFDVDDARYKGNLPPPRGIEEEEKIKMAQAYLTNHQRAREALRKGQPVILNATYSRTIYHEQLRQLTQETSCPIVFFLLEAPDEVIRKRIESGQQSGVSNITAFEDYVSVRDRYQEYPDRVTRINTDRSIDVCITDILNYLKRETTITS